MELDKALESRHSVRSFKNKNVSWKDLLEAVDAASYAPFADARNHIKCIIIENKEKISKIAELANQSWISQAPALIVVCSDDTNLEKMHGHRGRVYSRQQSGAAIENILLKLTELGLATCWVGSYEDELIKELLKIPGHIQLEALLPVGYESGKAKSSRKKALESIIRWGDWDTNKKPPVFKEALGPPYTLEGQRMRK